MSNLLSTSKERVYFKDLMSRFLFVSQGWIEAYTPGRTAEELAGKTDFDVFTKAHASAAFADEQEIIRTGEPLVGRVERETYRAGRTRGSPPRRSRSAATAARSSARSGSAGTSPPRSRRSTRWPARPGS